MQTESARVVAAYGRKCLIETADAQTLKAVTRGRNITPVCNDLVEYSVEKGLASIEVVAPREAVFWRYDRGGGRRALASHIDQAVIVIAGKPAADHRLLDRYIAAAEIGGQDVLLLWNKSDLLSVDDELLGAYLKLGYPLLEISAATGTGLGELTARLSGKSNLLLGLSGVGKSSLTNALINDAAARTSALSDASGEGTHTTTAACAYTLEDGCLIDTPGVREYHLWPMPVTELQRGYREIAERAPECRFNDCQHRQEPGCAVIEAVESGEINTLRYNQFIQLAEGLSAQYVKQSYS